MRRLVFSILFLLSFTVGALGEITVDDPTNGELNFGTQPADEAVYKGAIFTNNGSSDVTVAGYEVSGDVGCFALDKVYPLEGNTLKAGEKAVAVVKFSCSEAGEHRGEFCIYTTGGNACVNLVGTIKSTPPVISPPSEQPIDFGTVGISQVVEKSIEFTNNGSLPAGVLSYTLSGDTGCFVIDGQASVPAVGNEIPPGGKAVVRVLFGCGSAGTYSSELCVHTDKGNACVDLSGEVSSSVPLISSVPESEVDFGSVTVGQVTERSVVFKNIGTTEITITNYVLTDASGCFTLDTENTNPKVGGSLQPGEEATVMVKFGCTAKGTYSARLCFYTNLGSKCLDLSGEVKDVVFKNSDDAEISLSLFTDVPVDTYVPVTFKVENPFDVPLSVNCMYSGGWVRFEECPYTIPAGGSGTVKAEILPSFVGFNEVSIILQLSTGAYSWHRVFPVFIATTGETPVDIIPNDAGAGNGSGGGCSIAPQGGFNGVLQLGLLLVGLIPLRLRRSRRC